jgi:hypothetical protein
MEIAPGAFLLVEADEDAGADAFFDQVLAFFRAACANMNVIGLAQVDALIDPLLNRGGLGCFAGGFFSVVESRGRHSRGHGSLLSLLQR